MKIAVSACLLGVPCRYDGRSKGDDELRVLLSGHEVVRVCPEVMGGLAIPHPANEIQTAAPELRVVDSEGADNTQAFLAGSRAATEKALGAGCTCAILKAKSPSCGTGKIYDGSFTGTLVEGDGLAAGMMREKGLKVMDEHEAKFFLQNL